MKAEVIVDETFHGGIEANKSNLKHKEAFLGLGDIQKRPVMGIFGKRRACGFECYARATADNVIPVIKGVVSQDSVIITDSSPIYDCLDGDTQNKGHFTSIIRKGST